MRYIYLSYYFYAYFNNINILCLVHPAVGLIFESSCKLYYWIYI
jgi:hypothetical protein